MSTTIAQIEALARQRLVEPTARFWSSQELTDIIAAGIRDLWRDIVDLKQEHFLTIDTQHVTYPASATALAGVPDDVHKVYLIEATNTQSSSVNVGLQFTPLDYNHPYFKSARSQDAIDPANATIYYAISQQGAPVNAPRILCAPAVTSAVSLSFCYVPSLGTFDTGSYIPIPGECDNALVAWCVAYARAKESDTRTPDAGWLQIYATEKAHILESLGVRQYQEDTVVDAFFEDYWG